MWSTVEKGVYCFVSEMGEGGFFEDGVVVRGWVLGWLVDR